MATSPFVLVPTFVGLSLLGAYAGPVTLGLNGFGDANWMYILTPADPAQVGLPGAPKPFTKDYTGVEAVDGILAALVVYFSALIDGDIEPRFKLYGYCAFWQLGALVVILVLEGLRGGNRGRIASWTHTLLFIGQLVSWQAIMPLWVLLFLLTSPLAKSTSPAHKSSLLVDLWDITVMPLSVFLTIMLPTIAMYLGPSTISAKDHYTALAFWQLFPIWHYLAHTILSTVGRTLVGPVDGTTQGVVTHSAYLSRVRGLYDLVFLGGIMGQLPVLLLALAPDNVLSSAAESFPWMKPYVTAGVTLSSVYVPLSPFNYPTVDAKSIGSGDLAPLAVHFLHWDLYIGAGSLCLWALYVHRTTVKKTSLAVLLAKTALWFSLGGFASAVAALLWERDVQVLEGDDDIKKA